VSATNGKNRDNHDFYPTPRKFIELLFKYEDSKCQHFLEPAAGDGRIGEFVRPMHRQFIEKHKTRRTCSLWLDYPKLEVLHADFLEVDLKPVYDLIVTNPPYSKALEFVKKGLKLLVPGGRCIMLLRAGFLETETRREFNQANLPKHIYFLSERPKFRGKGNDASMYGWFVWQKGYKRPSTFSVISLKDLSNQTQIEMFLKKEEK